MPVSRTRSVAFLLVHVAATAFLFALAQDVQASVSGSTHSLRVVEVKTPRIRWSCTTGIVVGGRYPQVLDRDRPLYAVNAALRAAALADEGWLIAGGCPAGPNGPGPAYFSPQPQIESRISASSVVVSALIFAASSPPGANFSYNWTAATIRVGTATPVTITALFRSPRRGIEALAAAARPRLSAQMAARDCWVHSPTRTGIAPKASNYRYFALTTTGLAVGFTSDIVAPPSCGWFMITVPYRELHPYLSSLGRELIAGVRRPLR